MSQPEPPSLPRQMMSVLGGKVALLTSLSFLAQGLPRVVTTAAATALFLQSYGARYLPVTFVLCAVLTPILSGGYLWLERRASLWVALLAALAVEASVLGVAWAGIRLGLGAPFILLAMTWVEVQWALGGMVVWGLAGRMLTIREAKAETGRVGAGVPAAAILGGLAIPLALSVVSTADLLLVSAVSLVAAGGVVLGIRARHGQDLQVPEAGGPEGPGQADAPTRERGWLATVLSFGRNSRYVHLILLITFVAQCTFLTISTAFGTVAQAAFPKESELASFVALFMSATGMLNLFFSVAVSGRMMRRFGVGATLILLPAFDVLAAMVACAVGLLPLNMGVLLVAVAGMKLLDDSLFSGVFFPALQTVCQPLPPAARTRAQVVAGGYIEPLANGFGGLALGLLTGVAGLGAPGLVGVVLGVCLFCTLVARRLALRYTEALGEAFRRRRITADTVAQDPESSRALARRYLQSANPGEAIYALSMLEQLGDQPAVAEAATRLAGHASAQVRQVALETISRLRLSAARPAVLARLESDGTPRVAAAALRALAVLDGEAAIATLSARLEDPSPEVRVASMARLMLDCGIEGTLACGERFLALHRSRDPEERMIAARVLDEIGSANTYRLLQENLASDHAGIRRFALHAAGRLGVPHLQPMLLDALDSPAFGLTAAAALLASGAAVLPAVMRRFETTAGAAARGRQVWLIGRIGGPQAVAWLLERGAAGSLDDRWHVARALDAAGCKATPDFGPRLWEQALDAARCIARLDTIGIPPEAPHGSHLRAWIAQSRKRQLHRLFLVLGCLLPRERILNAMRRMEAGTDTDRAYALELIDTLLPYRFTQPLLAAIDTAGRGPASSANPADGADLSALAADPDGLYGIPMRAAALLSCLRAGRRFSPALFRPWLVSEHRVLAEVAGQIALPAEGPPSTPNQETPSMLMIEKILLLHAVPVFSEVPEELLAELGAVMDDLELEPGQWLIREGEVGDRLFVIVEGEVSVLKAGTILTTRGPGDVVGEMAALDPEIRSASIRVETPGVALVLAHSELEDLMAGSVELAQGLLRMLCRRLREANQQLLAAGAPDPDTVGARARLDPSG